ncbi:cardiolipin synthase [Marininema halotolerans]|uniref:Cardiolipin synthase n=1 Tax=Marininema halotolerans TaxID=1155944 RepID=A0A1I6TIS7_9BACL|nr:cardiolipin synthase [Marininema halotolerans]SFS89061.1 cardiolipin synthase [Marininema halotolerans]
MSVVAFLFGTLLIMNILLAVVVVFLERRDVSSTWAWLLVLSLIPVIGFILYLLFGRNLSHKKIFTWDKQSRLRLQRVVTAQKEGLNERAKRDPILQEYRELIRMHLNHDQAVLTYQNELQMFTDGRTKFDALLADLERAEDHIHLLYYIVRNDRLGQEIGEVLARKAREGVRVRLLYDDLGSRGLSKRFIRKLREAGGEVEAFFPSRLPLINPRMNYRNHRKLVIIDGQTGYIGGFNIGDEYLGSNPRFGYWRDTHLRIEGGAVHSLQARFILDWNQASHRHLSFQNYYYPQARENGDVNIQIVSSGPDAEWEQIKNGYIKMILSAKRYIYIQTPYFIPDDSLLDALRIAVFSGIDVRVMIPDKPDHPFVYWATYSYVGELLKIGGRVYIYRNGFLHAKTIVVDGKIASVGTANIDVRSFRLNFEVNAFLYHEQSAGNLANVFHQDMIQSTPLTWEKYMQRSLTIRFKESISRLVSPIL